MSDDSTSRVLPITVALGRAWPCSRRFLPWYSFQVVLPVAPVIHVFAVTTTPWGVTTLAPILIIAGSFVALLLAILAPRFLGDLAGCAGRNRRRFARL